MNNSLISVIVPVYNTEKYLKASINSVLAQTYHDLELILIDDGSTDSSSEICDFFAEKDERVCVIHQTNRGQAAARNRGIQKAKGKWICFVDSDDLIHPQMLELLYDAVNLNSVDMSFCGYVEAERVPDDFYVYCDSKSEVVTLDEQTLIKMYEDNCYPSWVVCFKLIRKDIVLRDLFTEGRIYEDNAVVCKWIYTAKNVAIIPYQLYFYRINPTGTTKSGFSIKRLDYLWALREIIQFYTKIKYEKLRAIFCEIYMVTATGFYRTVINQLERKDIANRIKHELLWVYIRNVRYVSLSREQCDLIVENLYPKILPLYWMFVGVTSTLKQGGMRLLLKKIIRHIK